ncbi:MAG: TolC family protein [Rhodocyclaceae bacterium]
MLENLRLLETIEQELATASVELASLTQLPLGLDLKVVEPTAGTETRWLDVPVEAMEEHALMRNPDLREGMYNARIARQETQRTLLKFFPGLSFNFTHKTSNDPYLINSAWNEAGAQISLNLLGFLSLPAQMRLADAGVALADQKRMATQMAVLTQLHIARLQYASAARHFHRADAIAAVDTRLSEQIANQALAEKQTKLDRVAQQTAGILSRLRRYQALSNAQAAAAKLQATLGLEPLAGVEQGLPLAEMRVLIGKSIEVWNSAAPALLMAASEAGDTPADPVALPQASRADD